MSDHLYCIIHNLILVSLIIALCAIFHNGWAILLMVFGCIPGKEK
jgi:hypothetical protein